MPQYDGCYVNDIVHSLNAGTFQGIRYDETFKSNHVISEAIYPSTGDHVKAFHGANNAIGSIFIKFVNREECDEIIAKPELAFLFPLVYSDHHDVPFMFGYTDDGLHTNHNMDVGEKLKRGYIYDRKIISDNRTTFGLVEGFGMSETLFAYSCKDRFRFYPNSVLWELSIYENSNISGCLTEGEIGCVNGMNIFTNCSFVLSAAGESDSFQQFNPYFVVALTQVSMALFGSLAKKGKEPSAPKKIGLGMFVAALGYLIMLAASKGQPAPSDLTAVGGVSPDPVVPTYLISTYLVLTFAELLLSPMGISFVSKVAPPKYKGLMMGCWFAATAIGNYLASVPSSLWAHVPLWVNWVVLMSLCVISGLVMFSFLKKLEAATA